MLTRDPLFRPVSPVDHSTEIQGAIINIAKWVLASLTAAVWMAADVGKVFFFFFAEIRTRFSWWSYFSPDVARKEMKILKKIFLYFGNEILWDWKRKE